MRATLLQSCNPRRTPQPPRRATDPCRLPTSVPRLGGRGCSPQHCGVVHNATTAELRKPNRLSVSEVQLLGTQQVWVLVGGSKTTQVKEHTTKDIRSQCEDYCHMAIILDAVQCHLYVVVIFCHPRCPLLRGTCRDAFVQLANRRMSFFPTRRMPMTPLSIKYFMAMSSMPLLVTITLAPASMIF